MLLWQQRASRNAWKKVKPDEDLARELAGHAGQSDRYMSVNEFNGWSLVKLLRSLRACYVDLDNCPTIEAALYAVDDAGLPSPSYAVHSGRGVHLYWLLEAVPPKALPVWQAIQSRLIGALASAGADKAAGDCTRVLRLVSSINSRNDREVLGYVIEPGRWTLHQLADEVLGYRVHRETPVASLERARAVRRAVQGATGPYQLWHSRYLDLCTVADHAAFMQGGVSEGARDKILFLLANALSWFTASDSLYDEIDRIARTYTPTLTRREVEVYTRPILERARNAAAGETVIFQGKNVDPRFHFKTDTLRDWLGDLITPDLEARLNVLKPRAQLQEQERKRQQGRNRVQEGRYRRPREEYLAMAGERHAEAQKLREQGLTLTEIARRLGVHRNSVTAWTKCTKSAPPV